MDDLSDHQNGLTPNPSPLERGWGEEIIEIVVTIFHAIKIVKIEDSNFDHIITQYSTRGVEGEASFVIV